MSDKPKHTKHSSGSGGEWHQHADAIHPTMTTQQGVPIADDQNSLRVGAKGPGLLEDQVMREKIFHFDHERIPEWVFTATSRITKTTRKLPQRTCFNARGNRRRCL